MTTTKATAAKWSVERKTLAGFVTAATILLLVLGYAYLSTQTFVAATRQVRRAIEVVSLHDRLNAAFSSLIAAHYAWRSTGEAIYQSERDGALVEARNELRRLREQTPPDALNRHRMLDDLGVAIEASLADHNPAADRLPEAEAAAIAPSDVRRWQESHARVARARQLLEESRAIARTYYDDRLTIARHSIRWLYSMVALAAVAMVTALGWLLLRIRRDLRERRAVENHLQQANYFLESLLENIPAMVFAKDAQDLRFVRFNRAGERLLGFPREQLLGKSDWDFFPPEQAQSFIAKDRETLAQGGIVDIPDEEIDTRNGERRTLHTYKVPVHDETGKPTLLLGISLDVTEQKVAERRIVALNEELTHQARLLQSSNEELESFCYSVSHDLRAPLRAINGYARLLEQEYGPKFDTDGARFLRTICNACDRMAQLIDDLLEFSRIGRQTLEDEPVDMTAVVKKVISDALGGRQAPLPIITTGELPSVRGDRGMLHLVWLNLIDNAVKYTSGVAAPHITVHAELTDDEVVYSVRDNGIGFDMQYADKLFGVFQRLHSDAKYPGTGVGLAIAQRIIARHGGRIWAHSQPGRGATFSFAIPRGLRGIDNPATHG